MTQTQDTHYTPVPKDVATELIGEGIHVGLRKGTDAPDAHALWTAISASESDAWADALAFCLDGLHEMGYVLCEKVDAATDRDETGHQQCPVPAPAVTDRDYEMYTDDANEFVALAVDAFIARGLAGGFTRNDLDTQAQALLSGIADVHGEVHDTEPEWAICDAINTRLCDPQGWTHTTRENW